MEDQIKLLIELQEMDTEIFAKKKALEAIPVRLKEMDDLLESKAGTVKVLEDEIKSLQVKHKEKEVDLETKEGTIKKHETQLFQVKTNQEYTALQKEIASIKADCSLLEEDIIGFLDRIEETQKRLAKEKEVLAGEKSKIDEEKKKMDEEKKKMESGLGELTKKREEFSAGIDKKYLSRYERILHNRDGLAMVPIEGDACGGCNMNLPPQVINEARKKKELVICGNCARILYWKD